MARVIIPNESFICLLQDITQTVIIDANLIIPPDRSSIAIKNSACLKLEFDKYKDVFLDPLFRILPSVAIHDSVYKEVSQHQSIKKYIDQKIKDENILLLKDQDLNIVEESIRSTTEEKIAQFTNYNQGIDNSNDRGEVKSISYAVAKGFIYFSTNDSNAISLIERKELDPYLHSIKAIKVYELIYAIRFLDGNSKILKGIYKLLYHLTESEKKSNFDWASFYEQCSTHYAQYCKKNRD